MPVADSGVGVERVPGGVHADELDAVLAELAQQAVALAAVAEEGVQIEVVGLPPTADAHLDVADVPLGAPPQRVSARKVGQAVVEDADLQMRSLD